MDSNFINFDGRSVHDMIELLLVASGDPEAVRRLQESINAVDQRTQSSITVINTAIEQLETSKQDAGDYVENGGAPGYPGFKFSTGAHVMNMRRSQNQYSNGISIMGVNSESDPDGVLREWFRWERNSNALQGYIYDGKSWREISRWTADDDTGWQTATVVAPFTSTNTQVFYRRKNGMISVYISMTNVDASSLTLGSLNTICTLPEGFTPTGRNHDFCFIDNALQRVWFGRITTDGKIVISVPTGTTGYVNSRTSIIAMI